ncbi:PDR/VanB family oxidoreductase [Pseudomonas putida]|uniref:PDR/VanB family oxidoreductase n=1 Tax=Pseudomonas putida TaxID=303 RepID=UPI0015753E3A|nr:PDR/VanB family oxidoreductase [Pseudomonas putida]NTY90348.1 oxidoreductase [Pseudomonas putida]NTY98890.1 oxidoreductase [Pseudomonas putida]NTZ21173.1 oxidoreductase [Pseudomonas putida]NTZ53308.1 oxidoreductase [Pseudomonas putida]NTZ65042.1 oxidoreductase [Pseudomonas putida]
MLQVNVSRKANEAEGICSFELSPVNGETLPPFEAGAHIDVHVPGGLIRQYSLCNDPRERNRYLISVLKEPSSRGGSEAMHLVVVQGDKLTISAPRNLFKLDQSAARHLLFAGGIGITPILAMAYELNHQGADFELHYCFRSSERAAFVKALADTPFADRVVLHDDSGPQEQKLNAAALLDTVDEGRHLYVCGPAGFMNHVLETGAAAGWQQERMHREFFAGQIIDQDSNFSFEVVLARSGKTFEVPADRTVFEVLDEAGVEIETSCEQGVCGTCVTRVLEGIPDHRDQFMTADEHARNDCFTPCCSRAKSPRLVLDL